MDPYFDIYVPRLVATLRESQLRARRKLHRSKEVAELFRKDDEEIAARLADGAEIALTYIGEKLVRRVDKEKVSTTIWTIINALENGNACNRERSLSSIPMPPNPLGSGRTKAKKFNGGRARFLHCRSLGIAPSGSPETAFGYARLSSSIGRHQDAQTPQRFTRLTALLCATAIARA